MKFGERVRLATPLPATWMSSVIIHNVYIKFYTDIIGLDTQYIGWVYLAFNIWNVLNDPVIGVWLDRKRAVPGKGKLVRIMRNMNEPLAAARAGYGRAAIGWGATAVTTASYA